MKTIKLFVSLLILLGIITVLAFSLVSCRPSQPLQHTIHRTDTIIERERLVPIKVEASQVKQHLSKDQLDSLVNALRQMPRGKQTIYYTDPKMQTRLTLALDSLGQLVLQCETLEKLYHEKLKEKDRIIDRKELEIREKEEGFFKKIERIAITIGICLLVIIMAVTFILFYLYRKLKNP